MFGQINTPKTYTPEQAAEILQLSKNTVYNLISKGEIVAKKLGKVYRIPATSLSFAFTGLDFDLYQAESEDSKNLPIITSALSDTRKLLK